MTRRRSFWSNVAAVAYKEASIVRHDRAMLATIVAQPIMMLLLFGYALSNKPQNVPWAVFDRSETAASRRLVQEIEATGYFQPPVPVWGYAVGKTRLREGAAMVLLVIPKAFDRDLERGRPRVQVLLDGSDPLTAARVGGYIAQVAAAFETGSSPRPRGETQGFVPGSVIDVRQRFWFNHTLRDSDFFLAALVGMLLTNLCLSATSLGLVAERETGTYEQMLAMPTTATELVLGKLIPFVVICYGLLVFATVGAGVIFGLWPRGSWFALAVVTLPFVLASLGIGVFVSALARTSAQAVFITVFFIMPSFVLSGVMFPYQLMPSPVRQIGALFPLRWYQIALRRIVARGAGLADVIEPQLALWGLFLAILLAIRWRMKPRLG